MKRLNDYIIEKQQINEAGLRDTLFGEIVMKILGTGLEWITKGVGWIADTMKEGISGAWQGVKGLGQNVWTEVCKDMGYRGKLPTSEKDYARFQQYLLEPKDTKERLKRCTDFYNSLIKHGVDKDKAAEILAHITGTSALPVIFDDNANDNDKQIAKEYLENLKRLHPKEYENIIKEYAKKIDDKKKKTSPKKTTKKDTKDAKTTKTNKKQNK